MEYLIFLGASAFGIAFHVALKLIELGTQYPSMTRKEIGVTFMKEEWDSLGLSGIITAFMLFAHFVVHRYAPEMLSWRWFELTWVGVCIIMGYQGQRLLYKWLNSAADALDRKVNNVLDKDKP